MRRIVLCIAVVLSATPALAHEAEDRQEPRERFCAHRTESGYVIWREGYKPESARTPQLCGDFEAVCNSVLEADPPDEEMAWRAEIRELFGIYPVPMYDLPGI